MKVSVGQRCYYEIINYYFHKDNSISLFVSFNYEIKSKANNNHIYGLI